MQEIAISLGGRAGARLCQQLRLTCSDTTLLNHLRAKPLPAIKTPRVLGVDEFAFRKGRTYGTILVNLETHQVIDLLPERSANTLVDWLIAHPGVEVLSRNRSKTYRGAMDQGAPTAIQVADRFHIVSNLAVTIEQSLWPFRSVLKEAEQSLHLAIAPAAPLSTTSQAIACRDVPNQALQNHLHKLKQQRQIKALRAQKLSYVKIAIRVGVSRSTVHRGIRNPLLPPSPDHRSSFGSSILDKYKP